MIYNNLKTQIIKYITAKSTSLNVSGAGKCYIGFHVDNSADIGVPGDYPPNADGSGFNEPTASCYKRIQANINTAQAYTDIFGEVEDGVVENIKEIVSSECKVDGGWGKFTHFGIFTTETGSQPPIAGDYLRDPDGEIGEDGLRPIQFLEIEKNEVAVFRVGSIRLELE